MRKELFLFIVALFVTFSAYGQLIGTGTITSPYSGTLTGNLTITGTKYFNGNIIVDNEILTISAGAKFISTSTSACIRIMGIGQLSASGTSTSTILFSADIDKDGINGESGDTWGNIYFTSTSASVLNYCIVENGRRTETRLGYMGGGLYMGGPSITLSNSIIRGCVAIKGGGIFIASGYSPTITNCQFLNNTANENGGAIYIASSSPVITSCVFRNNGSLSATLKGGAIASISGSPQIINSDILYSTSPATDGRSVYLENSTGAIVVNSIMWGASNHIGLSGTTSSVFSSCAIEGVSYAGCINLNSTNTAIDGPNFTNPTAGDFSLRFESPCQDAGVSTYPGVTIPLTDCIATKRVGNTDIGAYEMLYSRWTGAATTDWARPANWSGSYSPGTTRNVVIPSGCTNYPVFTPSPTFTLSAGLKMIVEPGARVTFSSLTNNGTLVLKSNATAIASLITGSYAGSSGNLTVNQFVTGGIVSPGLYRWHYIASPATVDKSVITNIEPYNLMMFDESKITTSITDGWQWHDGYDGTTGFSTLNALTGYDVLFHYDTTIVYSNLKTMTTTIGQINLPFSGAGLDTALFGYLFVGNSLTCGINWDLVTLSDPLYVRDAIYIRSNGLVASYIDGVGTNGGSAHIPPLQGFMVKTTASGTYITIPDIAKEHNSTMRFKSASTIPLLKLKVSSSSDMTEDETAIRLESTATMNFDGNYDAEKLFPPVIQGPQLYTSFSGDNYSINSIPWPESQTVIPLILKLPSSGAYKISRTELQGLGAIKAYLTDNNTNTIIDLSAVPEYSFNSESGTISGRFVITVSESYPGKLLTDDKSLKVYRSENQVCIIPQGKEWNGEKCIVRIYDMSGKLLLNANEEYFYEGELKEYMPDEPNGLVIVEVTTGGKKYSEKVIFKP